MKKTQNSLKAETFGHYAHQAIGKHLKKSIKPEAAVLKDEDPEALHQMRVGMRRLRTALEVFGPAIALPKDVSTKRIRKIAHSLGAVRDLDVLKAELETQYRPHLQGEEQEKLDWILKNLREQRRQAFSHLEETLTQSTYQKLKQGLQTWLTQPTYQEVASLPILTVLPDLLLPLISQLLLHSGWLFGTTERSAQITIPKKIRPCILDKQLEQQGEVLHDLRKQFKRVRYQTELFTEFYGSAFKKQVQNFQTTQEVLGQIQDDLVLQEFLTAQLETDVERVLPTLAQQMQQQRVKAWQTWQPIQQRYLDLEFRAFLRAQVVEPKGA